MKRFLLFFCFIYSSRVLHSQIIEDTLPTKSKIVSFITAGYGYANGERFYTHTNQDISINKFKDKGCLYLKGEWKPNRKRFGIGITLFFSQISYSQSTFGFYNGSGVLTPSITEVINLSNIGIGLRYNYYFINKSDIQVYVGFGGGGKIPTQQKGTPIFAEALAGVRLFITNYFAFYSEVGIGKTIAQAGGVFTF